MKTEGEQSAFPIDQVVSRGVGGGGPRSPKNSEDGRRTLPEREAVRRLLGKYLG